jgi:hypothetical protein
MIAYLINLFSSKIFKNILFQLFPLKILYHHHINLIKYSTFTLKSIYHVFIFIFIISYKFHLIDLKIHYYFSLVF